MDDPARLGALGRALRGARPYRAHPGYPGIGQGEAGLQAIRESPDTWPASASGRSWTTDQGIVKLDTSPVIMGHSFGGTFAQILIDNGLGSAGVAVDGAGVKGISACRSPS